jgi:hypothetical protein
MSVNATLRREHIAHSLFDGLYYDYLALKVGLLVCDLEHPIGKAAQKSALAKLYNSFFH